MGEQGCQTQHAPRRNVAQSSSAPHVEAGEREDPARPRIGRVDRVLAREVVFDADAVDEADEAMMENVEKVALDRGVLRLLDLFGEVERQRRYDADQAEEGGRDLEPVLGLVEQILRRARLLLIANATDVAGAEGQGRIVTKANCLAWIRPVVTDAHGIGMEPLHHADGVEEVVEGGVSKQILANRLHVRGRRERTGERRRRDVRLAHHKILRWPLRAVQRRSIFDGWSRRCNSLNEFIGTCVANSSSSTQPNRKASPGVPSFASSTSMRVSTPLAGAPPTKRVVGSLRTSRMDSTLSSLARPAVGDVSRWKLYRSRIACNVSRSPSEERPTARWDNMRQSNSEPSRGRIGFVTGVMFRNGAGVDAPRGLTLISPSWSSAGSERFEQTRSIESTSSSRLGVWPSGVTIEMYVSTPSSTREFVGRKV